MSTLFSAVTFVRTIHIAMRAKEVWGKVIKHGVIFAISDPKRLSDDFLRVVEYVREKGAVSTAILQRGFCFGYGHAASVIEMMESKGLVSPMDEKGLRKVYRERFPAKTCSFGDGIRRN